LSYPLPLLSITTHLALLSARLPALISEGDEDPLFDDDWEASGYLYPKTSSGDRTHRPTITLLVIVIGDNIIFDASREELAVADAVIAVSVGLPKDGSTGFQILAIRTIDPPSRLTTPGIPNSLNNATGTSRDDILAREVVSEEGVWNPPRGGLKRVIMGRIMAEMLKSNGVVKEIMEGLDGVVS
jgi:exosome complex component RRP42